MKRIDNTNYYIDLSGQVYFCLKTGIKRPLKAYKNTNGRFMYTLWHNCKRIQIYRYRLLWKAFKGEIPKGLTIDHIDNNKTNDILSNLQLLTRQDNSKKRWNRL